MKKFALFISGILVTAFAATTIACAFSANMNEEMGSASFSSASHTEKSFSASSSTSACESHCLKSSGQLPLTTLSTSIFTPFSEGTKLFVMLFILVQAAIVALRRRTAAPPWKEAAIAIFSQLKPRRAVVLRD